MSSPNDVCATRERLVHCVSAGVVCAQVAAAAALPPPPPVESLQGLWNRFNNSGLAFLDLAKMEAAPETGVLDAGPRGCLLGDLHLVPGQFGASSQV